MHRFPDFDRDLRRPYPVDEDCYDCAEFYHGCNARPSYSLARCRDCLRLPDVMSGATGRMFPPSRMRGRTEPQVYREAATGDQGSAPVPASKQRSSHAGPRLCECRVALPKGKRLCEACRVQNRRQTKRQYMRDYMQRQRSLAEFDAISDVPSTHAPAASTQASGGYLPAIGPRLGVPRK